MDADRDRRRGAIEPDREGGIAGWCWNLTRSGRCYYPTRLGRLLLSILLNLSGLVHQAKIALLELAHAPQQLGRSTPWLPFRATHQNAIQLA